MTIEQALINVIGEHKYWIQTYNLKEMVVKELGNNRNPMDSTILRSLRRLRTKGYEVICVDTTKSLYSIWKV